MDNGTSTFRLTGPFDMHFTGFAILLESQCFHHNVLGVDGQMSQIVKIGCQDQTTRLRNSYHQRVNCGAAARSGSQKSGSTSQTFGDVFNNVTCFQHPVGSGVPRPITMQRLDQNRAGHNWWPKTLAL